MVDAPERMVLQPCAAYGWEHPDRVKYGTEYTRSDLVAEQAAENERLKQEVENWKTSAAGWQKIANVDAEALSRTGAVKVKAWKAEAARDALIEEAKDFSERMTSQPWACELIDRLIAALEPVAPGREDASGSLYGEFMPKTVGCSTTGKDAVQAVTEASLLDQMAGHLNWELDWGSTDPSDETSECAWRVHARSGNRNDREWTLLGHGETPADALSAALQQKETGR